jgi:hypothetical protein
MHQAARQEHWQEGHDRELKGTKRRGGRSTAALGPSVGQHGAVTPGPNRPASPYLAWEGGAAIQRNVRAGFAVARRSG